jgi:O-antigen/teichoic acid export membrane protein
MKWAFQHGFWALADQAGVSLGNFLTNIILARALLPSHYGAFALFYGVFLFLNSVHAALVIYPLSIRTATARGQELPELMRACLNATLWLFLPMLLALGGTCWLVRFNFQSLFWIFIAFGLGLIQETYRRSLMAQLKHQQALWGDYISYLGQAVLFWLLWQRQTLSLDSAFQAMALTTLGAILVQIIQLWQNLRPGTPASSPTGPLPGTTLGPADNTDCFRKKGDNRTESVPPLNQFSLTVWKIYQSGGWMLWSNLVGNLTYQMVLWTLFLIKGTEATAQYQSLINVLGVLHPLFLSLMNLLVPLAARVTHTENQRAACRIALNYGIIFGFPVGLYLAAVLAFPHFLLSSFYGVSSDYLKLSLALQFFIPYYLFSYLQVPMRALLNAWEKTREILTIEIWATMALCLVGPLLMIKWAVLGGILGLGAAALIRLLMQTKLLYNLMTLNTSSPVTSKLS